jgi:hypothetical protein
MMSERDETSLIPAAFLCGVAVLGFIAYAVHAIHLSQVYARDHVWHGNDPDPVGSILGGVWFFSSLLGTIAGISVRPPARTVIVAISGVLTLLSILWFVSIGVSK